MGTFKAILVGIGLTKAVIDGGLSFGSFFVGMSATGWLFIGYAIADIAAAVMLMGDK